MIALNKIGFLFLTVLVFSTFCEARDEKKGELLRAIARIAPNDSWASDSDRGLVKGLVEIYPDGVIIDNHISPGSYLIILRGEKTNLEFVIFKDPELKKWKIWRFEVFSLTSEQKGVGSTKVIFKKKLESFEMGEDKSD